MIYLMIPAALASLVCFRTARTIAWFMFGAAVLDFAAIVVGWR